MKRITHPIETDIAIHMLCKLIAYFYIIESLNLYGMNTLRNRDKTRLKIKYQSFITVTTTKSKHLFTSRMDRKYRHSHDCLMTVVSVVPEAVIRRCSLKKVFLGISQRISRISFNKLAGLQLY